MKISEPDEQSHGWPVCMSVLVLSKLNRYSNDFWVVSHFVIPKDIMANKKCAYETSIIVETASQHAVNTRTT